MFNTRKTFFEATRMIDSHSTETNISGLLDDILNEETEYKPFDELMIRRINQQAI